MNPETARKTWRTAEPIHGFIYFLPEAAADAAAEERSAFDGHADTSSRRSTTRCERPKRASGVPSAQ